MRIPVFVQGCGNQPISCISAERFSYILAKRKAYIQEHPIDFNESSDAPCLDALWWHYTESHSMDSKKGKHDFRELRLLLSELGFQKSNEVVSLVLSLNAEQERIAFISGLQLGAQLILELEKEV